MIAQLDPLYIKTRPTKAVSRLVSYALFEGRPLTTRGQWINPLVFAHFAVETRLPQLTEVEKPVFIVGTGRSGSTVLGVLMSMHRDVGFLNEPKALWHAVCPDGDVFGQYPSDGTPRYSLGAADATQDVRRRARRLFGAYLKATRSRRVVDKYPELVFRVPFVRGIFPDARFVFLVRDGRDTCRSIEDWSGRKGVRNAGEVHDWWGADNLKWRLMLDQLVPKEEDLSGSIDEIRGFDRHVDLAAVEWVITMREGLRNAGRYPNSFHTVRYESLVANPRKELSGLIDFCELPQDETFLSFAEQKLVPAPPKDGALRLHPAIRGPFEETAGALGYLGANSG
ncbi:sulfotransferase family protein [Rubrobacter tropicus]|uniref:sulfotransferase family protein n=1 Tax=Rubrobacter tropicus TaxID=2653851 RepID=UPI001A9D87C0|nr:sulfotransferase [Rubrobacter tropicus]